MAAESDRNPASPTAEGNAGGATIRELLFLLKRAAPYVERYEEWDEGELISQIRAAIRKVECEVSATAKSAKEG